MAKRTPEQQAQYALAWHVSRSDLSAAAQLEYDRLKADQEREAAATRKPPPSLPRQPIEPLAGCPAVMFRP